MRAPPRAAALLTAVAAAMLLHASPARATSREAQVKAAYIYKFASFVRWPPEAFTSTAAPIRLCVFGRKDILGVIESLARTPNAGQRPVEAVGGNARTLESTACHVLFLGEGGTAARELRDAHKGPVLTISDRGGASDGGLIELVRRGDTVRFVIHRGEAERRRLALSSKLLAVAEQVLP